MHYQPLAVCFDRHKKAPQERCPHFRFRKCKFQLIIHFFKNLVRCILWTGIKHLTKFTCCSIMVFFLIAHITHFFCLGLEYYKKCLRFMVQKMFRVVLNNYCVKYVLIDILNSIYILYTVRIIYTVYCIQPKLTTTRRLAEMEFETLHM